MIWPGRAEAALQGVMGNEGGLDGIEDVAPRDALNREDIGAVATHRQREA